MMEKFIELIRTSGMFSEDGRADMTSITIKGMTKTWNHWYVVADTYSSLHGTWTVSATFRRNAAGQIEIWRMSVDSED